MKCVPNYSSCSEKMNTGTTEYVCVVYEWRYGHFSIKITGKMAQNLQVKSSKKFKIYIELSLQHIWYFHDI